VTASATLDDHPPLLRSGGVSVAKALGSPTRAGIYEHLRDAGRGLTVRDVADAFDIHPNVARTHLETLADAGLVAVGRRKHPGGGRPAKLYYASKDAHSAAPVVRGGTPAVALLLVRLLACLAEQPRPEAGGPRGMTLAGRAQELATAEGRKLVSQVEREAGDGLEPAVQTALRALRPYAPAARVVKRGADWIDVAAFAGMFAVLAEERPELAETLERGLLVGALGAALSGTRAVTVTTDAGTLISGEPVWRIRSTAPPAGRSGIEPAVTVDARGRQREVGVVWAMRAVTALRPGDVLEVLTEGPGAPAAFARWADRAGHQLLGVERATDAAGRPAIRLLIRKGA
jgi:predicted ArsR family transcriptional regulator/TusA-related sulfurtransferase